MEATVLNGFIEIIQSKLSSLASEKYKLQRSLKDDIRFLEKELAMIHGAIDDQLPLWREDQGGILNLSMEELRELAHRIEDSIDRFIYHSTHEKQASLFRRIVGYPKNMQSRQRLAAELQLLKKIAEEANERKERYAAFAGHSSCTLMEEEPTSSASDPCILVTDLVGIDEPRDELLGQLVEEGEGQPRQLKVISIVGFSGSGKTVLAKEVYNSEVGRQFSTRAWICAADKCPRQVLIEILHRLGRPVLDNSGISQLSVDLREHLDKKRYFIVIDDMRTDQWSTMESAFPGDDGVSSRVMVTTSMQSVANACSSANGYVHKMRRLGMEHSKQLFFKRACRKEYSGYLGPDSAEVLKICDGQLALVSMSQFLRKIGWPTRSTCEDVCRRVGHHLVQDDTLQRMRRALTHSYASLSGNAPKACLLYFGMFPSDHPVRRKRLMRRWLAEGLVHTQASSSANFDTLIDRNIIEPIDVGNNDKVKTCRTYGMMHEFILHMSNSQNFSTLFGNEPVGRKYVRWLSIHHNSTVNSRCSNIDLSLVRSLTIFGEAAGANFDLHKYQLLRVLDVQECSDFQDDNLKYICNLLLLKYVGSAVTSLPKDIEKLKLLETLDLRRTKVEVLPIQVMLLPCLIYLFGKFKISEEVKRVNELWKFFLSGKCNLETLAGFVTDLSQGFPQIMSHMKKLWKVKIWCERNASSTNLSDLQHAIQKFIHDENESNEARSLSLHFDKHCCEDLLSFLKAPCYLRSLKLQGRLLELPQFVLSMRGLRELYLSSTKLTTTLLAALSELRYLQYLKLIAHELEEFIIRDQAFPRLLRICFVLQCPTLPVIEEGALQYLTSLQLICKDLVGLAGMKIEFLRCLKEVSLGPRVTPETRQAWENAVKEHPNKPKVLLLKTADPTESEPTANSVGSEPAEHGTEEAFFATESVRHETSEISIASEPDEHGAAESFVASEQAQHQRAETFGASERVEYEAAETLVASEPAEQGTEEAFFATESARHETSEISVASEPDEHGTAETLVTSEPAYHERAETSFAPERREKEIDDQMLTNHGPGSSAITKKRKYSAVESSSSGELNSSYDDTGISESSLSFPRMPHVENGTVPSVKSVVFISLPLGFLSSCPFVYLTCSCTYTGLWPHVNTSCYSNMVSSRVDQFFPLP